ncbi:mediator of RNA polymerase II transcription subunit, partial [Striga asiatica]
GAYDYEDSTLSASQTPFILNLETWFVSDKMFVPIHRLFVVVQAADSLLKLVSELKQIAIFPGFASLDDHVDRNFAESTNRKLSRIGEEVAESHYYSSVSPHEASE